MSEFGAGESSDSASSGYGAGQADKSSPREMAAAAGDTVKQEVATFASGAQEKVHAKVEGAAESATRTLGEFASAVKKAGDELSEHDQSLVGKMVKQAGDGLENLARSLADKSPESLIDAARDFSRRNPAAFIAGGVLLGLAAGRFLRSSAPQGQPKSFRSASPEQALTRGKGMPDSDHVAEASGYMERPADLKSPANVEGGRPPFTPGI